MRRLARIIRDHPVVFLVLTAAVWIVLTDEVFGPASMRHTARDVSHATLVAFLLLGGYLAFRDASSRRRLVAKEQSERIAREVREWLPINVDDPDELREYLADHDVWCLNCGYNLRGLRGDTCPECGGPVVGAELFQLATFGIPNSLDVLAPTLGTPRWSKPRRRTPLWMRTVAVVLAGTLILLPIVGIVGIYVQDVPWVDDWRVFPAIGAFGFLAVGLALVATIVARSRRARLRRRALRPAVAARGE